MRLNSFAFFVAESFASSFSSHHSQDLIVAICNNSDTRMTKFSYQNEANLGISKTRSRSSRQSAARFCLSRGSKSRSLFRRCSPALLTCIRRNSAFLFCGQCPSFSPASLTASVFGKKKKASNSASKSPIRCFCPLAEFQMSKRVLDQSF